MPRRTQKRRSVRIATPLGDDVLLIKSMTGTEQLGRPFQYELVLLSENHENDYRDIIGQSVTVSVDKKSGGQRCFNGFVSRFAQTRFESELVEYQATVVPWLWFLTRTSDCRIFQNLTVPEIIAQVFRDYGFTQFEDRLHGEYIPREYCVQYRETSFNFVSRLMEQEGIYYFFEHKAGGHTLVLCDSISSHLEFPGYEELTYRPRQERSTDQERLWSLVVQHEIQPGTWALNDFDFQNPKKNLLTNAVVDHSHAAAKYERFDYPGLYQEFRDGERYSRVRLEEQQVGYETYRGEGDARGICTGARFTLKGHPREDFGHEYLTIGTQYRIESDAFESLEEADHQFVFEASLMAIDSSQPFRPARTTPQPVVQGPQTAIVVGPPGEEIHTDSFGRVRVQFHWDRYSKADQTSSCWVRVAQVWAGRKWGSIYTPRIGQEVIVDFLEGDPDRPIVTGRVYNGDHMPPYELPAQATLSTLKSLSSKGGGGFNEIRFEDKKSEEQLFIHAERNLDLRVKADAKETVCGGYNLIVGGGKLESVEKDRQTTLKANEIVKITGDEQVTILGNRIAAVSGNDDLKLKGDQRYQIDGGQHATVNGDYNLKVAGKLSQKAGGGIHQQSGGAIALDGGSIHINGGQTVVIEAGASLTLKAGGSFVNISGGGVFASGPIVGLNSGGAAGSGSGCSPNSPAAPSDPTEPALPAGADDATPGGLGTVTPRPPKKKTPGGGGGDEPPDARDSWIAFNLKDDQHHPVAHEPYEVTLSDGDVVTGSLDDQGRARLEHIPSGECKIKFPRLDKDEVRPG